MNDITVEEEKLEDSSSPKTQVNINHTIESEKELVCQLEKTNISLKTDIDENIVCKGEENDDELEEKQKKLKNNTFYIEVVNDKTKARPETEMLVENVTAPPPTPRRVNKLRDHSSNIFPAGCMGCREDPPSDHVVSPRRFLDPTEAKDHTGHIDNTPRKRPSSAKPNNWLRNPLTGVGVEEEIKKPLMRRKDGNPLLGEGYEIKEVTPSSTRIPPGGYSQGLW